MVYIFHISKTIAMNYFYASNFLLSYKLLAWKILSLVAAWKMT